MRRGDLDSRGIIPFLMIINLLVGPHPWDCISILDRGADGKPDVSGNVFYLRHFLGSSNVTFERAVCVGKEHVATRVEKQELVGRRLEVERNSGAGLGERQQAQGSKKCARS